MSLIDRQGRLLKRWNVIDVAACLLAVGLLWSVYAVVQVASGHWRRRTLFTTRPLAVELQAIFLGLDQATAHKIHVGDVEVDPNGHEIARILEVSPLQRETLVVRFGDQDWVKEIPRAPFARWEVPVRLRVLGELRGDVVYYEGRYIGSGARIQFRTPRYTVRGFIYDEGWVPVLLKTAPLTYEQASRLVLGARQLDSKGHEIVQFRSLVRVATIQDGQVQDNRSTPELPPAKPPSISRSQKPPSISRSNDEQEREPEYELLIWVELHCIYYGGTLLFQGAPMELGSAIPMQLADIAFEGIVNAIGPFRIQTLTIEAAPGL